MIPTRPSLPLTAMKLYTSIEDMPAYNWFKCVDEQAYEWCSINRTKSNLSDDYMLKCKEAFAALYEQYIDKYGISEHLQEVISLQNQIMVHKIDVALGDRSQKMLVSMKEIELAKLMQAPAIKGNPVKAAIEKHLGFRLNMKEISVVEYYDYIEEIKSNKAA